MNCTFCGDLSTGPCTRKHLEWIIVLPSEIKEKDIWKSPVDNRKTYVVIDLKPILDEVDGIEGYRVFTAQKRSFQIFYPELPVLVRRHVLCGWPRCEFHCGKCMLYRESDERQAMIRGEDPEESASREKQKKAKRKKADGKTPRPLLDRRLK
jgi:hypothetical protein